jgi:hypothetical protein
MRKPAEYRRLSIVAKQARQLAAMREPPVTCPHCDVQTAPADLLRHVENSCPGSRQPHPLSKWVTWAEALQLGVPPMALSRWVRQGRVRWRVSVRVDSQRRPGRPVRRMYLLRDISKLLAIRSRISNRRVTNPGDGDGLG